MIPPFWTCSINPMSFSRRGLQAKKNPGTEKFDPGISLFYPQDPAIPPSVLESAGLFHSGRSSDSLSLLTTFPFPKLAWNSGKSRQKSSLENQRVKVTAAGPSRFHGVPYYAPRSTWIPAFKQWINKESSQKNEFSCPWPFCGANEPNKTLSSERHYEKFWRKRNMIDSR